MAKRGLTPKQQKFVAEYCVDQNGGEAAKRAGYAASGAYEEAYRLLKKAQIRDAIQRHINGEMEGRKVKVRTVLNRLDDIASFDPLDKHLSIYLLPSISGIEIGHHFSLRNANW